MGIIPSKKKKNRQSQNGTVKRPTIEVKEEDNCCKELYVQSIFFLKKFNLIFLHFSSCKLILGILRTGVNMGFKIFKEIMGEELFEKKMEEADGVSGAQVSPTI